MGPCAFGLGDVDDCRDVVDNSEIVDLSCEVGDVRRQVDQTFV